MTWFNIIRKCTSFNSGIKCLIKLIDTDSSYLENIIYITNIKFKCDYIMKKKKLFKNDKQLKGEQGE